MHSLGALVVAGFLGWGLHDERQGGGVCVVVVVVSLSGARMYSLGVAVVASFIEWREDALTRCSCCSWFP